jgi:methionine synthase II (cobalamin-independent)
VHSFSPELRALHIGSLPHIDPRQACTLTFEHFPEFCTWPQLPQRTFSENMYAQFSERFPGVILEQDRIWVDRTQDLDPELEALYNAYLDNDLAYGQLSIEYALGLHTFLRLVPGLEPAPTMVKGQVTGPISWGLTVVDQDRRPILYDEILADAAAKHLRLKASWQEAELRRVCQRTILSVDEPFMSSFGSAYVSIERDQAIALMEEVFAGIQGLKMVHCCGNTDWSLLLATSADILSFDAYEYALNLALYPDEIAAFLERGGTLAWGITPNTPAVTQESVESLVAKLLTAMDFLVQKGIHRDDILRASWITPACGLGTVSQDLAERNLSLTAGVSSAMRERYT